MVFFNQVIPILFQLFPLSIIKADTVKLTDYYPYSGDFLQNLDVTTNADPWTTCRQFCDDKVQCDYYSVFGGICTAYDDVDEYYIIYNQGQIVCEFINSSNSYCISCGSVIINQPSEYEPSVSFDQYSGTGGQQTYQIALFTTDNILSCPVEKYSRTSGSSQITLSGCSSPNTSQQCRTVQIDTSIDGTFTVTYEIEAKGGTKLSRIVTITINFVCASITIYKPDPLQVLIQALSFEQGTGMQEYTLNSAITSDNVNCPVSSYQVTSTTSQVNQTYCVGTPNNQIGCRKLSLDTAAAAVYSITYTLTADGAPPFYVTISLTVYCGSNVVIIAPIFLQDSQQKLTFDQGTGDHTTKIETFNTDVPSCPIISYQLVLSHASITQSLCLTPDSSQDCRSATISTNYPLVGQFDTKFLITSQGGNTQESEILPIFINGCVSQAFSPLQVTILPDYFFVDQPGSEQNYTLETFKMSAPTNLCKILSYDLQVEGSQTGISQIASSCANSSYCKTVTFDTSSERTYNFIFIVTSNAQPGYDVLQTQIMQQKVVCGAELQTVSNSTLTFVYNREEGAQTLDFKKDQIKKLFSSNIKACEISRFDLFQEIGGIMELYRSPIVNILNKNKTDQTQIQIQTSEGFRYKIYVFSFVKDKRADEGLELDITVCGSERLITSTNDPLVFHKTITKTNRPIIIMEREILDFFQFHYDNNQSSESCDNQTLALYQDNELKIPYAGKAIEILQELSFDIRIHTNELINRTTVYLGRITKGQVKAYIAFDIEIMETIIQDFRTNWKPIYLTPLQKNYTFDTTTDELNFIIQLPEIQDDQGVIKRISIVSDLGKSTWTNEGETVNSIKSQVTFIYEIRQIEFKFEDQNGLMEAVGTHLVTVKIEDDSGGINENTLILTFQRPEYKQVAVEEVLPLLQSIQNSQVFAEVKSLNQFGELIIEFNKDMQNNFNVSLLNSTNSTGNTDTNLTQFKIFDIYVFPDDNWNLYYNDFYMQQINLTWFATSFSKTELKIKLNFNNQTYISPNRVQDQLFIHFASNQSIFRQSEKPFSLLNTTFIKTRITKQMDNTSFWIQVENAAVQTKNTIFISLIFNFVLNAFLISMLTASISGNASHLISLINALQFVFHLPLMSIIMQANVMIYLKIVIPIVMFDIITSVPIVNEKFNMFYKNGEELNIQDQTIDLGYDTHDALLNMKFLSLMQCLYILRLAMCAVLYAMMKSKNKIVQRFSQKVYTNWIVKLIYSEIISIFLSSIVELLIAGFIGTEAIRTRPANMIFSLWFLSIPFVILPFTFTWLLFKRLNKIQEHSFQQKFGQLSDQINLKSQINLTYYFSFVIRRCIFVLITVLLSEHTTFQIIGINFLNLSMLIYVGAVKPFISRQRNNIELLNELLQSFACLQMTLFSDWVLIPESKFFFGWQFIMGINAMIFFNMFMVIKSNLNTLRLLGLKFYLRGEVWVQKIKGKYFENFKLENGNKEQEYRPNYQRERSKTLNLIELSGINTHTSKAEETFNKSHQFDNYLLKIKQGIPQEELFKQFVEIQDSDNQQVTTRQVKQKSEILIVENDFCISQIIQQKDLDIPVKMLNSSSDIQRDQNNFSSQKHENIKNLEKSEDVENTHINYLYKNIEEKNQDEEEKWQIYMVLNLLGIKQDPKV